ncbi:sensor histidine kinase [Steroidobacter agaridevorans]|uniref:sensor histidine kinase n=1 Tax=Steroidobacter agaridevorans TaxID=2695856 RepID=UPI0013242D27|nr:histidine kinase [Steroidobacter agaridevorans]GFE87036.1 histidine kinase [Steroidobacter agaridevorans]
MNTSRAYWACQLLGWGLYGSSQVSNAMATLPIPWERIVVEVTVLNLAAIGLTQLLREFMLRRGWKKLSIRQLLPRALVASVLLGSVVASAMHFMAVAPLWGLETIHDPAVLEALPSLLVAMDPVMLRTVNWSLIFFIWIALYIGITSVRERQAAELRQSELSRALQAAELKLLKSQLNPHFLFNSLNSVRALIAEDPARARDAVTQLAGLLRYTLRSDHEELVTLERELKTVGDYLALESLRLGDRLRVELDIAPGAQDVRVPVMLLQTVVENAIKHGIAELPGGGVLRISATLRDSALHIEVSNPRPINPTPREQQGSGLYNAAERLRLLFGSRASLELDLSQPDLAIARIRVPSEVEA